MTATPRPLTIRLQNLGFKLGSPLRLYGENLEVASDPMVVSDDLVLVDAIEKKTGKMKRVRIPLPVLKMAIDQAA